MTRLLPVALLLVPVALAAAPVPKEDDAALMRRNYGVVFAPEKDGSVEPKSGTVRIALPDKPRMLAPWCEVFNAPRVWKDVTGDFTVSVKVAFPIRPKVPNNHPDATQWRAGGGIVAWADDENFMTVTRDEREYEGEPAEYFRSEAMLAAKARGYAEYSAPKESGFVRLQRKGKTAFASFSTDGEKWQKLGEFEVNWKAEVKVGVFAENSFKAPFAATFGEYKVSVEGK